MRNRISLDEKRVLIANCGSKKITQKNSKLERTKRILYCGYFWGDVHCENCKRYEASKRAAVIRSHINGARVTFKCAIDDDKSDWDRLYKKLNKEKIDYIAVPQENGSIVVVTDGDPNHADFLFEEIAHHEAIWELTSEKNLFPTDRNGNTMDRRSSRGWRLTKAKTDEQDGIEIEHLYAVFENKGTDKLISSFVIDQLSLAANTWSGGEVGENNAQAFVTHGDSLYIEMHCAAGWTYNKDKSFIRTQKHSLESIQQWKARHRVIAEDVIYGHDENGFPYNVDSFCGAKDKLYAVLMGDIPIIDRLAELKQYKEEKRLKEELGLAYDLFYPQHQYDEVEQSELNNVVVY